MKRILLLIAALSVVLFGFGTAHAVLGVNDRVPGMDVVSPFMCEFSGPAANPTATTGIDTFMVVGDVRGQNLDALIGAIANQIDINNIVSLRMALIVYDRQSNKVFDTTRDFSFRDIVNDSACLIAVNEMSEAQRTAMAFSAPNGKSLYAGYAIYALQSIVIGGGTANLAQLENFDPEVFSVLGALVNRFASWVYLVDTNKGFASPLPAFNAEFGVDLNADNFTSNLFEGGFGKLRPAIEQLLNEGAPVTLNRAVFPGVPLFATKLYPRYFLVNGATESFNWWIFLFGNNRSRSLNGDICNEEEDCTSLTIPVSNELNIVSVSTVLPGGLHTGFAKAGMGLFKISVGGKNLIAPDDNIGIISQENARIVEYLTSNNPHLCDFASRYLAKGDMFPPDLPPFLFNPAVRVFNPFIQDDVVLGIRYGDFCDTVLGWAYQRAEATSAALSWDVIHEVDRNQCNGFDAFGCNLFGISQAFSLDGLNDDNTLRSGAWDFFPLEVLDP